MSDEPYLPTRHPRRSLDTAEFWDGCAQGRLLVPRCNACAELIWYPRRFCPFCASTSVTYEEMSGRGTVYSFTVSRRGRGPFRGRAPYVVAYVELDEGPRILTNIVGVGADAVQIGLPVRVVFEPADDGHGGTTDAIPRFTRRSSEAGEDG